MGLISFQIYAYDFISDGIHYNILSETDRTVTGGNEYSESIVIPPKAIHNSKTYSVIKIGKSAFKGYRYLTSLTLPNSITTIETGAFKGCCSLTSLTLPNSLTTIASETFEDCFRLTSLTLPNSLTSIGYNAFKGCSSLTSLTLSNSLTSIGNYAFQGCSSLTSLTLPNSLTSIRETAFEGCSNLENIFVDDGNIMFSSIDGVLYNKDASTLIRCPLKKTSVTLPSSLTTIGGGAFIDCSSLTSLTFPNSLTTIGAGAFKDCSSLTSLTLPNSLTTIEENAFYSCNDLKRINMLCETPIECNPRFSEEALKNAILYIPIGTLAEYEKVDPWRNFWNIKEVNFAGINETEADDMSLRLIWNNGILSIEGIDENESITIYDMSGHVVHSGTEHNVEYLVPGIYIVKAGKRGTKFAVLE